jgi:hypothetical protein
MEMEATGADTFEFGAALSSGELMDIHIVQTNGDVQPVNGAVILVIGGGATLLDTKDIVILVLGTSFNGALPICSF